MKKVVIIGAGGMQIQTIKDALEGNEVVFISTESLRGMSKMELLLLTEDFSKHSLGAHIVVTQEEREVGIQNPKFTLPIPLINYALDDLDCVKVEPPKKEHPFKKFMGNKRNF